MKRVKDKERFIELRAGGMSFAKIAQEIGVSKPTLIKWNVELGKEIENRRFLAVEELLEQYKLMQMSRIQMFSEMLGRALDELRQRHCSMLSFKELLALINHLEEKLLREGGVIRYTTDQHAPFWDSGEDQGPIKIALFDQK